MDANVAVTQFTAAGIVVWFIQQLKTAPWFPLLKKNEDLIRKRALSIIAAFAVHTGISYVWSPGSVPGVAHVLMINIPPVSVLAVSVWHWLSQFVMQEGWYQVTYNRNGNGGVKNAPKTA